jgi:hypothetical protein
MKTFRLKRDATLRVEPARGLVVEVAQGQVWLTQECDARDYFLRARDWLRIDRANAVVISAIGGEAWIALVPLDARAGRAALAAVPA